MLTRHGVFVLSSKYLMSENVELMRIVGFVQITAVSGPYFSYSEKWVSFTNALTLTYMGVPLSVSSV